MINKIIERIEELDTEQYDSEQSITIHTDSKDVPEITSWEVEAALRDMKISTDNNHINIETLKAGEDTISKTLAKLYTKCLSEKRIPTTWKNAKMVIIFFITVTEKQTSGKEKRQKVTDVFEQVRRRMWTCAVHVRRIRDNRWTLRITTWKPYDNKIHRGRPARRWRDDLDDYWKGTSGRG